MEYKVEDVSPVKKKVNITVPAQEVGAALSATTALYRTKVDIKGFRKGKAPSSVIEGQFKKQIYQEATTDLVNLHINEILAELKLTPLSRIDVEGDEVFTKGQDYEYAISFEIAPVFDLPEYEGLEIEQEKAEVTDEDMKTMEQRFLDNMAKATTIEDVREPVDGDIVTVSFSVWEGDKILDGIQADNFEMTLGDGQALPEFEELLKTLKASEKGEKEVEFPEDFINTNLAGKKAVIKATLHAIKEKVVPELTDQIAVKSGFDSADQLREALKKSYLQGREDLFKGNAQKKMMDDVLARVDFPLPPSMVEERIDMLIGDMNRRLELRGKNLASLGKSMDELRSEQVETAEDIVKNEIFLMAVANEEGILVSPEEIDAYIKNVAERTGQPFYELRSYYEENNLLIPLKDKMLCDKAMDYIYSEAKITYVEPKGEEESEKAE